MRIQKYMSEQGILSRRETEKAILAGLVKVNGEVVRDLGRQVDPVKDKIELSKSGALKGDDKKITVAYYKPRGIVSAKAKNEGQTVFDLLPQFSNLNCVGRLDKESEGLILLSNDGVITASITGDDHKVEKEYDVKTRESVKQRVIDIMERGMTIDNNETTLPAKGELFSDHSFKLILKEGKRHQIRRMCAALNLTIENLKRVRVGNINLRGLKEGEFRILTDQEVSKLKALAK